MPTKNKKCHECTNTGDLDYYVEDLNIYVCDECVDIFNHCESCEGLFSDSSTESANGSIYCDECFNDEYKRCVDCGEAVMRDDVYWSPYCDDSYCEYCYYEVFTNCDSCGESMYQDDIRYCDRDDSYYCDSCYDDGEDVDLDSYNSYSIRNSDENKFEKNKFKRLCGIELETVHRGDGYSSRIEHPGYEFSRTGDGSISGDGVEWISSPMNGDRLFSEIDKMTDWLRDNNFGVNRSCGYHLHIDARDLYWPELCGILIVGNVTEKVLYDMMPKSRRKSNWCRKSKIKTDRILEIKSDKDFIDSWYEHSSSERPNMGKYHDSRYHGINMHSRVYLGTIEFRHHSGTTDKEKIKNWITICQSIVEKGIGVGKCIKQNKSHEPIDISKERPLTKEEFINHLNLKDLEGYINNRIDSFIDIDNEYINNNYIYRPFEGRTSYA